MQTQASRQQHTKTTGSATTYLAESNAFYWIVASGGLETALCTDMGTEFMFYLLAWEQDFPNTFLASLSPSNRILHP